MRLGTAEVEKFRKVGLSLDLRNEIAEMERVGAISPFEVAVFSQDMN